MFVIPDDRLPSKFAERVDRPPAEPSVPVPAATVVLMRDGDGGPETLLLRRNRSSGFVPGAYVFAGGRVDEADTDPRLTAEHATGLDSGAEPDPAFWIAAAREAFEETGVLLGRDAEGRPAPDTADPRLAEAREALLTEEAVLRDVLAATAHRLAFDDVVYLAHWITPEAEPRRYDTRFFLAALPDGREVRPDAREMTDARWLRPADALDRFEAGRLPMVFPTVKTLESLAGFDSVADALESQRERAVSPILPRLVRTEEGVGIVVEE